MATIAQSNVPDQAAAVGVPRIAAIEHAFGRTLDGLSPLLVSVAGLRAGGSPRSLSYLGLLLGAEGIVSTTPVVRFCALRDAMPTITD